MKAKNGFSRSDAMALVLCIMVLFAGLKAIGTTGRERAKIMICQNNLKRLSEAMNQFLQDNDDKFCDSYSWYFRRTMPYESLYCKWHNQAGYFAEAPDNAGSLWPYMQDTKLMLCPTFDRICTLGWGKFHWRHDPAVAMVPQFNYSMNGYLGPGRFGVVERRSEITADLSRVFVFTEENTWIIHSRSTSNASLANTNFIARRAFSSSNPADPYNYPPDYYNAGIATYHNAPSQSLELIDIDGEYYATQQGINYPTWGLCRGGGNAVFLDGHVQLTPSNQDPFEISWPLGGPIIPSPWYGDLK